MRKRNESQTSIRKQLLYWLLLPLGLLWIVSSVVTYLLAESYADEVYDDQMVQSAQSVVARIMLRGQEIDIDMQPAAIAVLRHNFKDKFYFQVISSEGKFINGDAELPLPSELPHLSIPLFGDAKTKNGEEVRTVLVRAVVQGAPTKHVFVQCAETLESRKALARHILISTTGSQLLLILFGAAAVSFGVTRGLRRLDLLRQEVSSRSQSDLSSLDEESAPLEVRPLVRAINNLLEKLKEDLLAKQRFVSNAAHQLRTPIAGLKTYIGLLKKVVTDANAIEVINQLDAGTDKTTHMVNRLLALAKAEPDASAAVSHIVLDLNDVASESTANLVAEALSKNIDLSFEPADNQALIYGDVASLQELVTNIVENAVRYTPNDGSVAVSIKSDASVRLIVEDTGPGIPEPERERVFERFYRILGTGISGTGLGLAIVNEIARSHNARVLLSSGADGKGTKVTVEFMPIESSSKGKDVSDGAAQRRQGNRNKD